jgi:hypothetical protein
VSAGAARSGAVGVRGAGVRQCQWALWALWAQRAQRIPMLAGPWGAMGRLISSIAQCNNTVWRLVELQVIGHPQASPRPGRRPRV